MHVLEVGAEDADDYLLFGIACVIAHRDSDGDLHGINAWPATGIDLKFYPEGSDDGQED